MKAILLTFILGMTAQASHRSDCGRDVSAFFQEPARSLRAHYVEQFLASGYSEQRDRTWEWGINRHHPYWFAQSAEEGDVVRAYLESRHFDYTHLSFVLTENTNFFAMLLFLSQAAKESEGITLWISIAPGCRLESIDAGLFIERVGRLMLDGKLILVIEENSPTRLDREIPAYFIQPAA